MRNILVEELIQKYGTCKLSEDSYLVRLSFRKANLQFHIDPLLPISNIENILKFKVKLLKDEVSKFSPLD